METVVRSGLEKAPSPPLIPRSSDVVQPVALLKGMSFRTTLGFAKARKGDEGLAKVIASLPEPMRAKLGGSVLATEYFPFDWIVALQSAVVDVVGGEKRAVLREIGRYSCENALTTVYKIFFKLGSPEYIIRKAAQVYGTYFKGGGEFRMLDETKGSCRLQIDRYPGGHADFCRRLDGYFEMVLELSGGKSIQVVHSACAYTSPTGKTCEWIAKWS